LGVDGVRGDPGLRVGRAGARVERGDVAVGQVDATAVLQQRAGGGDEDGGGALVDGLAAEGGSMTAAPVSSTMPRARRTSSPADRLNRVSATMPGCGAKARTPASPQSRSSSRAKRTFAVFDCA